MLSPAIKHVPPLARVSDLERHLRLGRKYLVVVLAFLLMVVIGVVDYGTGWELSLYVFYAAPILLVVWFGERRLGLLFAIFCGLVWWLANESGHPYRSDWSYHWASMGRTVYFILVAVGGNAVRAKQEADRAQIAALENTRRLEREIVAATEHEQQRIGRDLHDGLCQHLAAIGCAARSLADDLRNRSLPEAGEAEKIEELLRDTVSQARSLARGVCPVLSDGAGLAAALEELASTTKGLTGTRILFREEGDVTVGDPEVAMHLYRIAQEALNNALRHSGGGTVLIAVRGVDRGVELNVTDDGAGLPGRAEDCAGMGFRTMEYRARAIGARLEIAPAPGGGTRVRCVWKSEH